jgi:hypothetical protein
MDDKGSEAEGRWLIAENLTVRSRSFPHPERDASESEHLHLGPFEAKVIEPVWLESPAFTRYVYDPDDNPEGYIAVYRSDTPPTGEFTIANVIEDMSDRGVPRPMALHAFYICAQDPIGKEYATFISLEPSVDSVARFGATSITAQWDLLRNHLPWIKEVRALEERWRKRDAVLAALDVRIDQLEEM